MLKPTLLALISLPFLTGAQANKPVKAHSPKPTSTYTVKQGDTVLYGKYAGTEITIEGAEYLIMRESDILAIV